MDVRNAARQAMSYIKDLFEDENISNIGLEEVKYDDEAEEWIVTVGFSRPWDYPKPTLAVLSSMQEILPTRTFKAVRIRDKDFQVVSVTNR